MLLNTLAASFIWGINTLFLLDAGLSNTEAFAANALFTVGQVLFEIPTGIVADTWGRRTSYLLGTITLAISTLLYMYAWQIHAPFWMWGATSILLGLGFTFFSGATEAWLVDALEFTGYKGSLETVFAKGQMVSGAAMLAGSVAGGLIAQSTNLGVPYIIRAVILALTFCVAFIFMKDVGFQPKHSKNPLLDIKEILSTSVALGLKKQEVRWIMLEGPFSVGVSFYVFYAMQPYLLKLYGNPKAYGIAGLAAAIVAGAQIAGGLIVPQVKKLFKRRTTFLCINILLSCAALISIGLINNFPVAIALLVIWALVSATRMPVRQTYLNEVIPSKQRATILSFDSLIGSSGGVVVQPVLGKVADVWNYPASYIGSTLFQIMAVPFILLARHLNTPADTMEKNK